MSFINLATFCMTLFLMVFVFNVSQMSSQKLDLRNSVDEAAVSAATVRARGLNAVTAINHLIGELAALVVLHDSIGGERIYNRRLAPRPTAKLNRELAEARWLSGGVNQNVYELVMQRRGIRSDKAVMEGKKDLKRRLTWIYRALGLARLAKASKIPFLSQAGLLAEKTLKVWEFNVGLEYRAMNSLEAFARRTYPLRRIIEIAAIPGLKLAQFLIVKATPEIALKSAQEIGRRNSIEIWIDPRDLQLPLMLDPHADAMRPQQIYRPVTPEKSGTGKTVRADNIRNQMAKTTQLGRATYPWVLYHRKPILDWSRILFNSRFSRHYRFFTWRTSVDWVEKVQRENRNLYGLYVLKEATAPNKGYEQWTETGADHLFTVSCLGWQTPPRLLATRWMGRRPALSVAAAQAMTYNANRQQRMKGLISNLRRPVRYRRQAAIGWDTLNFRRRMSELVNDPIESGYPGVRLNWQSKLVPISAAILRDKLARGGGLDPQVREHLERYTLEDHLISIR